jgi:hypothetical protein
MNKALPDFLSKMVNNPPQAGSGVHTWLFSVSRNLHAHMSSDAIVSLLEDRSANCGRRVTRREIENAVNSSLECAWRPIGSNLMGRVPPPLKRSCRGSEGLPGWPELDEEERDAVIAHGGCLADLQELSNPRLDDTEPSTEHVIDMLFPGNPLLCCGGSSYSFDTKPREEWRGQMSDLQLIVPSPMSAPTGLTQDGKESTHTLANTGHRRFLIVEFDSGSLDDQAALLAHLGSTAPLACVVFSGSKSLHGWFYTVGHSDETVESFFSYAVSIGADRATWTRSQFVRMPCGLRDGGKRQRLYYLNAGLIGGVR